MQNLYSYISGSGYQVVLADKDGFLLETIGDPEIIKMTKQIQLCPGGNWDEASKGTNAIGTSLVERRPIHVFAREHYCQPNHFLTCSASPIFDPDGLLLGALDITGDYKAFNPHSLAMVVASVNAIENQLRLHKATNKLYTAYKFSNTLLEAMSDGLISVDNNGIITQLNSYGAKILGVNSKDSIGKHINNVFRKPSSILQALSAGTEYKEHEIVQDDTGKKLSHSVSPLRDDLGNTIGALADYQGIERQASG